MFISHRSEHKVPVSELKDILGEYGVDAFVAHQDIQVSVQWRDALIHSLKTMHCLLAYITDDFSENNWCSQEVGFACVSGARIIPLRVQSKNPSGFLSFYQAANVSSYDKTQISQEIISKLIEMDHDLYIQSLLHCLNEEANYVKTKNILEFLMQKEIALSNPHLQKLEEIYALNDQVRRYFHSRKYIDRINEISKRK